MKIEFEIRVCPIEVRVHLPSHMGDGPLHEKLDEILDMLATFKEETMSALTDLQAAVAAESSVVASAVVLLGGLKLALDEAIASGDPAALAALSAAIGTDTASLSAAIVANTPIPPTPVP